ncbi:cyclopropane fatty acyl phospholipid synthase [Chitinophaga nivalis]|uniref:Cyclopropane fatty acyl phospholipid synthase n=1 Tax=Chitinophaga nivalis TaxID=2991709 RepID=A0ABT3IKQ4_9BACT|nr:cyclopropane fatty acyl phospholipid synthase [Chitinophaga nivalis]MCW3465811.1 cyclopropane fatty acyl phospholipid synthase [Chitinophaga nivalis]MCW3484498.1 cyclopropane fatty acyl phospholipid synthase [Chitinophaga nivalis]
MKKERAKKIVTRLLSAAGITVNGNQPADIQIYNDDFYRKVLLSGSMGLGESYMEAWWDCRKLDEFFCRVLRARLEHNIRKDLTMLLEIIPARLFNLQSPAMAFRNGRKHYDIGNDLFESMLDKRMTYTCGFWEHAHSIDEAQEHKLDLTCRKLKLQPGQQVLDIGCGWGSFAKFAAERYGVRVTGITISEEQAAWALSRCKGLPVDIKVMDYRQLTGKFDAIASLGMFEHVGAGNYQTFMRVAHQCLHENGLLLLHTIGGNRPSPFTDKWLNKYIFPHAVIPAISQIGRAIEGWFVMEHWQNFSVDYDKTLLAWYENVNAHWSQLSAKYGQLFFRMWKYYLLSCAGSFRARDSQLWQIVLSPHGVPGGYRFKGA